MTLKNYDSDEEVSKDHAKLLKNIASLDKRPKWIKRPERNEPALKVSELNLVKSTVTDKDLVRESDLLKHLGGKAHHREVTKLVSGQGKKRRTFVKPAEKPIAERLKRQVGYKNTKIQLRKWDPIVTRNRVASQLDFASNRLSIKVESLDEIAKRYTCQSELAKKLAALEPEKENEEVKHEKCHLTLAEILQKKNDAAKFRKQMSYEGAKAHWKKKIKSRNYHRVARKEKIKQQLKEFELLQKTNPEAALEKLEQLNKAHAEERMSLKHKGTGQWAKNKLIRAKYDKESRQALAQTLSIGRELTQKLKNNMASDDEEEKEDGKAVEQGSLEMPSSAKNNPWMHQVKTSGEINDFLAQYRQYSDQKEKEKSNSNSENKTTSSNIDPKESMKEWTSRVAAIQKSANEVQAVEQNSKQKSTKAKKQNLKRNHGDKDAEKSSKSVNKKIKKAGTSQWVVETVENDEQSLDKTKSITVEEIFDKLETKLHQKAKKKLKSVKTKLNKNESIKKVDAINDSDSDSDGADLSFKKKKLYPEIDEALIEGFKDKEIIPETHSIGQEKIQQNELLQDSSETSKKSSVEIDPNAFINVKPKHLKTLLPSDITEDNEALDDEEEENQHSIITEAFADDDVVDEFRKEKESAVKESQPDDIDLRLPGWGSWGGPNKEASMRKKRRFIINVPKEAPRRDENKGNVIIFEGTSKMKEHQVQELPYPFTSVADFEASIRAPIGRDFIPENAHRRLIAPKIKTRLGRIIEPMDEEVLLKKKSTLKGDLGAKDPQATKRKNPKKS